MDWTECNYKKLVKRISVDNHLVESLLIASRKKLTSANRLEIDNTSASSIISLCYESLRAILEALAISKGYKIYNHECYTAFLKEIIKEDELSNSFDKFRKIRNSINYYGKDSSPKTVMHIKTEIVHTIKLIKTLF